MKLNSIKLNKTLLRLIISFILAVNHPVTTAKVAAEQDDNFSNETNEPEEVSRWFEVELIVFKPNNENSMADESWDKKLAFNKTENLVDFLQPFYLENDYEQEFDKNIQLEKKEDINNVSSNNDLQTQAQALTLESNPSIIDINSIDEEANLLTKFNQPVQEKPFVLLAENSLQLSNEVSRLNRHADYKVLTHLAWRQPMLGKNDSATIRIAGGLDLSNEFAYDGSQLKKDFISDMYDEEAKPELELINDIENINQQSIAYPSYIQAPLIPQIIPMLWVPELDGDIKIYLNRYLHIQTNLFLRKPGKEVIEAIDLDLYNPELLSRLSTENFDGDLDSNQTMNSSDSFFVTNSDIQNQSNNPTKESHPFSWEISDSFLNDVSEKMFIERLFNYSIKQSRRVRSGELHYFDHPLLGMIILITPYELPIEPAGNLNDVKKLY